MNLKEKKPLTYAVVVGTNELKWLDVCFRSLLSSDYPALHVIYVDNASTDGSLDFVETTFPSITVLRNKCRLDYVRANNVAIRLALSLGADYIFLLNPDTRTPVELISQLVNFMEIHSDYGIVGPLQYTYETEDHLPSLTLNAWSKDALMNGERHIYARWEPWRNSEAGPLQGRAENTLEHTYVQGAAIFIRRIVIEKVGLFDETLHTYYEEVDLCRRARWIGYRVALLLNLSIQHYGGGGTQAGRLHYQNYYLCRNRYYYLFTEPTYSFWQASRLAAWWVLRDIKMILYGNERYKGHFQLLLLVPWWLASHIGLIRKQRAIRLSLYQQYCGK